ncbi:hypothetical protein Xph01_33680 [Micromonospora phaseoli]|nr:hypothetical protein Xph01_33680 [Micromonospora phaseoli]
MVFMGKLHSGVGVWPRIPGEGLGDAKHRQALETGDFRRARERARVVCRDRCNDGPGLAHSGGLVALGARPARPITDYNAGGPPAIPASARQETGKADIRPEGVVMSRGCPAGPAGT